LRNASSSPIEPDKGFICRVLPVPVGGDSLRCHISIYDWTGGLRETINGGLMKEKDLAARRTGLPDAVPSSNAPLATIGEHCRAVTVIDRRTIAPFAAAALTTAERERWGRMGTKRQGDFLAARLALKQLFRKLAAGDLATPASAIETVMPDGVHPGCGMAGGKRRWFCSVSHDPGFAIAVADDGEIGVDVERISDKVLRGRRIFLQAEEMTLTERSPLGVVQASLRAWSIKECAAKIMDRPLAELWKAVTVDHIDWHRSRLHVGEARYSAVHDIVGDHCFTLVRKDGAS
jgi:4'-phosphopantetheinyl transferase EntD